MNIYDTLINACNTGNIEVIKKMFNENSKINYRSYLNDGLYSACNAGNIQIINFLIDKGANDINSGLFHACKGGNLDAVNLLIKKGAAYWDWAFWGACQGGNLQIDAHLLFIGIWDTLAHLKVQLCTDWI